MTTFQSVLEGFKILSKYGDPDVCAEHDEIYIYSGDCSKVSLEDRKALKVAGWDYDKENGGWRHFI